MAERERPILFAARVQNKNFHPRTFLRALSILFGQGSLTPENRTLIGAFSTVEMYQCASDIAHRVETK
jgi:hypothetical protein